jgi:hypothetical protein
MPTHKGALAVTDFKKTPMAAHQFERDVRPYTLDPTGAHLHKEDARLRQRGPATVVELPGGVVAWSVTSASLVRQLMTDSRVSKDTRRPWHGGDVRESAGRAG